MMIFQEATSVLKNLSPFNQPNKKTRDAFLKAFIPGEQIPKISLIFKVRSFCFILRRTRHGLQLCQEVVFITKDQCREPPQVVSGVCHGREECYAVKEIGLEETQHYI